MKPSYRWIGIGVILSAACWSHVAAQDIADVESSAGVGVGDRQMPSAAVAVRGGTPNPSEEQQRLMDELTEASDATRARNQLEAAQRMAPVDLLYGLPADR